MRERFHHYCRINGFEFSQDWLINEVDYCGIGFYSQLSNDAINKNTMLLKGYEKFFRNSQLEFNQAIVAFVVQSQYVITILEAADALVGFTYPKAAALRFMFEAIEIAASIA